MKFEINFICIIIVIVMTPWAYKSEMLWKWAFYRYGKIAKSEKPWGRAHLGLTWWVIISWLVLNSPSRAVVFCTHTAMCHSLWENWDSYLSPWFYHDFLKGKDKDLNVLISVTLLFSIISGTEKKVFDDWWKRWGSPLMFLQVIDFIHRNL